MTSAENEFELGTDGPSLILVGVDGSRTSLRAAAYAAGLARRQHCRLLVVHVSRLSASIGVPTARNAMLRRKGKPEDSSSWHQATIKEMLINPAITGMQVKDGKPWRGPDGIIVQRCEGIIDAATWETVKAAISGPSHRAASVNANPLLHIAFCGECGAPLHVNSGMHKGKRYSYYRCQENSKTGKCKAKAIPLHEVDETFTYELMRQVGDVERVERVPIPAEDHADELALVEEAITSLRTDRYEHGLFRGARGAQEYADMMSKLEDKRDYLESLPSRPASYRTVKTGQTYRDYWAGLDADQRRQFLLNAEIKALVIRADQAAEVMGDDLPVPIPPKAKGVVVMFSMPELEQLRALAAAA